MASAGRRFRVVPTVRDPRLAVRGTAPSDPSLSDQIWGRSQRIGSEREQLGVFGRLPALGFEGVMTRSVAYSASAWSKMVRARGPRAAAPTWALG